MRVGNFSVMIPEGVERESGHVQLPHGKVYTLRLLNHDHRRCDAEVTLDGKSLGGFRIDSHGSVMLERPTDDTGRFTFFKADSQEAAQSGGASVSSSDRGLIQVVFKPEKARTQQSVLRGSLQCFEPELRATTCDSAFEREEKTSGGILPQNLSAGVTGLTGKSDQSFYTVAHLDYDESGTTTISIRLVCVEAPDSPRPLKSVTRSNPVPRPV